MREFSGAFETHLTVAPGGHDGLGEWAAAHGFKYSEIVLDRGRTPEQPMLTRHARGTLGEQVAAGREWARRLAAAGHGVVRLKVEASADNAGVPRDAAAAAELPECYFEHHVKVLLPGGGPPPPDAGAGGSESGGVVAALRAVGAPHGAHVSRNARRHLADGTRERFLTQRCRAVGRAGARARLDALLDAIGALGVPVLEVEEEFVVYDDNLGLDAGWIG